MSKAKATFSQMPLEVVEEEEVVEVSDGAPSEAESTSSYYSDRCTVARNIIFIPD